MRSYLRRGQCGTRTIHGIVCRCPTVAIEPSTLTALSNSWDFKRHGGDGLERFAPPVKASLARNPALELLDVVSFADERGNVNMRITGLHLTYAAQQARQEVVLVGKGV